MSSASAQVWSASEEWRRTHPAPLSPSGTFDRVVDTGVGLAGGTGEPHIYSVGPITLAAGDVRYKITRHNQSGTLVNETTWPPASTLDRGLRIPHAMTIVQGITPQDGGSHVFVTGEVPGANGSTDMMTISLSEDLSTVYWTERYNHEPSDGFAGDDVGVAIDGTMNGLAVAGASMGENTGVDIVTVVYSFATGTPLMTRRIHLAYDDIAADVKLLPATTTNDASVFVTGTTGSGAGTDFVTAGYLISTGAFLPGWPQTYDNGGRIDRAASLAVAPVTEPLDGEGAVYVTGSSTPVSGGGTNADFLTLKYRLSGNSPRWTDSYNGPASGDDKAAACAAFWSFISVPPTTYQGAWLYVTGYSRNGTGNDDFLTLQFRDTGDAFDRYWFARYDGAAHSEDRAVALAVAQVKIGSAGIERQPHVFVTGYSRTPGLTCPHGSYHRQS